MEKEIIKTIIRHLEYKVDRLEYENRLNEAREVEKLIELFKIKNI